MSFQCCAAIHLPAGHLFRCGRPSAGPWGLQPLPGHPTRAPLFCQGLPLPPAPFAAGKWRHLMRRRRGRRSWTLRRASGWPTPLLSWSTWTRTSGARGSRTSRSARCGKTPRPNTGALQAHAQGARGAAYHADRAPRCTVLPAAVVVTCVLSVAGQPQPTPLPAPALAAMPLLPGTTTR